MRSFSEVSDQTFLGRTGVYATAIGVYVAVYVFLQVVGARKELVRSTYVPRRDLLSTFPRISSKQPYLLVLYQIFETVRHKNKGKTRS